MLGGNQRMVKVDVDGEEEEVFIDAENGPMWLDATGRYLRGQNDTGRFNLGNSGHEGSKAWYAMSKTEREVLLIRIARRQKAMKANV